MFIASIDSDLVFKEYERPHLTDSNCANMQSCFKLFLAAVAFGMLPDSKQYNLLN